MFLHAEKKQNLKELSTQFRHYSQQTKPWQAISNITAIIPITVCCPVAAPGSISIRIPVFSSYSGFFAFWRVYSQTVADREWHFQRHELYKTECDLIVKAGPCVIVYVRVKVDVRGIYTWLMMGSGWQRDEGGWKEFGSVLRKRWRLWMGGNNSVRWIGSLKGERKRGRSCFVPVLLLFWVETSYQYIL